MNESKTTKEYEDKDSKTFASLGINPLLCEALAEQNINEPFPIQEMAIPIALSGSDLIGQARTGTGKTLAFGLPLLQRIILPGNEGFDEFEHYGKPQALVMAPTRELAQQVSGDLSSAARKTGAKFVTIYGGVSYDEQLAQLKKGVDVVVGTPGRLLDLANQRALDLSHVRILVLDEADEMLDLGFLPDVENLTDRTPNDRQSLLFSATMPAAIMALVRSRLHNPVHIRAEGQDAQATVPDIKQLIYQAHELDKPEMIGKMLQAPNVGKVMIFTHTKRSAQRLTDELVDRGFNARTIHGDLNQSQRERTLKKFRNNQTKILVCTDVAARGIDVSDVTHVVNFEVPDDAKEYVHRIGRTGRAGASGFAVTLVDWQDVTRWNVINKSLGMDLADPPETYSTSENFLNDLQIPKGTKGRLKKSSDKDDKKPAEKKTRNAKPRPKRTRRRTKNGKVVRERSN
ncbi:DEAD/DEAH box helicase [Propionimicrobium lymphophilum]|uniref:DEAD/DEAH box helicase n=1 Tax=Propionimicrobium lymphophilum TaxID=33012 RepID=UPI002551A4DE|nr:DEAD/DEAH box helicase [Propionimicrobium lymphophilum]MDK7709332.1 DEAD/DEAH box helicase [Propionimicrobium lymphophilum]MDK7733319.1 DEAD/DEAH box helicase [Propionimicrobium lymphophilum]